jgi:formate/nitrite transporter
MQHFSIDAYTPAEIAARVEKVSVSKSTTDPLRVLVLAGLAGAFIAFGAAFFTLVTHAGAGVDPGLMRLIGGLVFCLGLVLVVVAGAELFTGNNLLVMACVDGKITLAQLARNWLLVYVGNFAGSLFIAALVWASGHWLIGDGAVGAKAVRIALAKVQLDPVQAVARGVLCNLLVCLAVWMCFAGRSVTDKVLAILFPITAFVSLGFEHSVANMYFIPAGMLAASEPQVAAALAGADLAPLTISGFLLGNLLPVTLGNIIGGGLLVGLVYWFIYLRE